jgi:FKBP-type peptidyl-prolyl cis-trans isomerase
MMPTDTCTTKLLVGLIALSMLTGCPSMDLGTSKKRSATHLPKKAEPELEVVELEEGTGRQPKEGQTVMVHYTGRLTNGRIFDSSVDRDEPYSFILGKSPVIKGWHEAVAAMKVGGKYRVTVPPSLGYGKKAHDDIPPNSTLIFEIELLKIKKTPPARKA